MSRTFVSGHFIEGAKGPIFVLLRKPDGPIRGCVLVVPPFAEEMNKCRRMVTEVALGLSERGVATLVPDLFGTGDSAGDFVDAGWSEWRGDLERTVDWADHNRIRVTGILAIRLGCALAVESARSGGLPAVSDSVFWQPVLDGRRYLHQFFRMRLAASIMEGSKETMAGLRRMLDTDGNVEVAGYRISRALVGELDGVVPPQVLPQSLGAISLLEFSREAEPRSSADALRIQELAAAMGATVSPRVFPGEPFWGSAEIVVNTSGIAETIRVLGGESTKAT